MPKTYFIKTFGCQMNVSDSERISAFLEQQGFSPSNEIETANLIIFNTCGIKQTAENRAYSLINNLRKKELTTSGSQSIAIVLTGCLANRSDVQKRMKTKVDLFCEIKNFPEAVAGILYNVSCINSKIQNTSYKIHNTYFASGGMTNNKIISETMEKQGFYLNKKIPRGDAGLSFGQIMFCLLTK